MSINIDSLSEDDIADIRANYERGLLFWFDNIDQVLDAIENDESYSPDMVQDMADFITASVIIHQYDRKRDDFSKVFKEEDFK